MYNRYIPQNGGYTRVREPDYADEPRRQPQQGSYRQAPYGFQQNAQQEGYRQAPYGAQQHAQLIINYLVRFLHCMPMLNPF